MRPCTPPCVRVWVPTHSHAGMIPWVCSEWRAPTSDCLRWVSTNGQSRRYHNSSSSPRARHCTMVQSVMVRQLARHQIPADANTARKQRHGDDSQASNTYAHPHARNSEEVRSHYRRQEQSHGTKSPGCSPHVALGAVVQHLHRLVLRFMVRQVPALGGRVGAHGAHKSPTNRRHASGLTQPRQGGVGMWPRQHQEGTCEPQRKL
jgi:hypothetical protein